jgi:sec-independent protein translocase protein TatA
MGRIGGGELLIIALIALVLFGGARLADIGRGLGEGIKNFKKGMRDGDEDDAPPAAKKDDTVAARQIAAKAQASAVDAHVEVEKAPHTS